MNLYEITKEIDAWAWALEQGDITEADALATLGGLEMAYDQKLGNIGRLIKNCEAEAAAIAYEVAKLTERKRVAEAKAERLKRYVACCLGEGVRWSDSVVAFGWRSSDAVEITDEAQLPDGYWREKVIREPDKDNIKRNLKVDVLVPGATLVKRWHLQVK